MKTHNLPDKESKIVVFRKLGDVKENTERQFRKISKTIHDQNKFNREIEIISKNSGAEEFNE